jgi:hypothetical protein
VNVKTTMSSLRRGLSSLLGRDVKTLTRSDYVDVVHNIEKSGRLGAAQDQLRYDTAFRADKVSSPVGNTAELSRNGASDEA